MLPMSSQSRAKKRSKRPSKAYQVFAAEKYVLKTCLSGSGAKMTMSPSDMQPLERSSIILEPSAPYRPKFTTV